MINTRLSVLLSFIVLSVNSYGQEYLYGLQSLPINTKNIKKISRQQKTTTTLALPFFDDFSRDISYPDPSNWTDSYVIINQTYCINPPTIGVATFDAINQKGELYKHLSTTPLITDTLTSQPINLNYTADNNIYFSFQYQPKGLGEAPDINDSLVVEFYSVDESKWICAWSASANFTNNTIKEKHHLTEETITQNATLISNSFFTVMIPVIDTRFLKDGFRFRFMNYASLPLNTQVPSVRGNSDHWHIDMVYLDKYRTAEVTTPEDVAFTKPLKSFLKNYESIPWKHFNTEVAQHEELTEPLTFKIQYHNYAQSSALPDEANVTRNFVIQDLSNKNQPFNETGGAVNILPYTTIDYTFNFDYIFQSNWVDSAKFDFRSSLETHNKTFLYWNDTVKFTQTFLNYYAYDDGSAENSYGINGEGTENGMVAVKFHSYLEDSLKGIQIYFCRTYKDETRLYDPQKIEFKLTVWNDSNGKPGNIIYQKGGLLPIFTNELNKFTLYAIDEKLKVGGDFWIGWVNTTTNRLNVGFDLNNTPTDKLYYNLYGEWVKSQFEGSLMLRPVFGKLNQNPTNVETPTKQISFSLYPNPTTNQVTLNIDQDARPEMIRIINLSGQTVLNKVYESNQVDVSSLPIGIYLFQLTLQNRSTLTKKLVIIK